MKTKNTTHSPPRHVAIIMDGNGRWAVKRGKPRTYGHIKGVDTVRKTVATAVKLGIRYLTLYVFSKENWNRPAIEVNTLMHLIVKNIHKETGNFMANGIRLLVIGDLERLPIPVSRELQKEIRKTAANTKLTLVLAINYSGRREIVNAAREIAVKIREKEIAADSISESLFTAHLATHCIPDPELVIRTSGECRISNFLLWQMAHSELLFIDKQWPDFTGDDLNRIIADYLSRKQEQ